MSRIFVWAADGEVRRVFRVLLEQLGHESWSTHSAEELQLALSAQPPQVLIIDLDNLSDFFSYMKWSATKEEIHEIPRLMICGRRAAVSRQDLSDGGETALSKPLKRGQFLAALEQALSQAQELFVPGEQAGSAAFSAPELEAALMEGQALDRVDGRRVGSVILQREIGRGGMGVVFKGRQSALHRDVAVKMILPRLLHKKDMITRMQREALAVASLSSPHIVRVFDAGYTSEDVFYIIMEWLDGDDIEISLQKRGRFGIWEALAVTRQIAMGLHTAHQAGLVHRDIKSSNIIIHPDGHATLTDFGLAYQDADMRLTGEGVVLGTAHYLSPEQVTGSPLDPRSDIYSLGIVLYEMLVGIVPFPSEELMPVMYSHLHDPLPSLGSYLSHVPAGLGDLLMGMTAKEPRERFASCEEVMQAIDTVLAVHQPVALSSSALPSPLGVEALRRRNSSMGGVLGKSARTTQLSTLSTSKALRGQFRPGEELGSFRMSISGAILAQAGALPSSWPSSIQLFLAMIQQLEATVPMGSWREALCEATPESIVFGLEGEEIGAELFAHGDLPSSLKMVASAPSLSSSTLTQEATVLQNLSAAAGVEGLVLLGRDGVPRDFILPPAYKAGAFLQRLSPVATLLSSLPLELVGVDFAFEEGRVLIWALPDQFLVVLASSTLNKTLLSLLVWQYQAALGMDGAVPAGEISGKLTPTGLSGALTGPRLHPLSTPSASQAPGFPVAPAQVPYALERAFLSPEEVKAIQLEFATFIGPMARLILKKELKKLGFSSKTIPEKSADALLNRLASHLESPKKRAFLEQARSVLS